MSAHPMSTLREEQQLITSLIDVLKQEQSHLIVADIPALTAVTPAKTALVQRMTLLAAQRHRALGAAGFAAGEAGMEPWLTRTGDTEARAQWQDLLAQTRAAKELNRVNGMLINRHMGHTQGALDALRPKAKANSFYGPSGLTTSSTPSRGFLAG